MSGSPLLNPALALLLLALCLVFALVIVVPAVLVRRKDHLIALDDLDGELNNPSYAREWLIPALAKRRIACIISPSPSEETFCFYYVSQP